jgi:hypothetical protein
LSEPTTTSIRTWVPDFNWTFSTDSLAANSLDCVVEDKTL